MRHPHVPDRVGAVPTPMGTGSHVHSEHHRTWPSRHMANRLYAILAVIALTGAGCAHRTEAPELAGQADSAVEQARQTQSEKDPRYAIPHAEPRSLTIYLGSQTFAYEEGDRLVANGPISSGSKEHPTPTGDFRVLSKEKDKRSGKYTNYFDQNTPMPYSLQFYGPYFIHEGWLPGHADSHGCVRLRYEDARFLFSRMKVGDRVRVIDQGQAATANPWLDLFPVF